MSFEFFLSDIVNLIWILIGIFGVSMAFKMPVIDDPKRRRRWFWSLAILAIVGFLASHFDKALNARTQAALQGKLDTSIANEGSLQGQLGLIGMTLSKSNCQGFPELAAAIKQEVAAIAVRSSTAPNSTAPVVSAKSFASVKNQLLQLDSDVTDLAGRWRKEFDDRSGQNDTSLTVQSRYFRANNLREEMQSDFNGTYKSQVLTALGATAKVLGVDWNDFDSKSPDEFPDLKTAILACDSKKFVDPSSVRNCGIQLGTLASKLP